MSPPLCLPASIDCHGHVCAIVIALHATFSEHCLHWDAYCCPTVEPVQLLVQQKVQTDMV